jgi:hypothetical protein
LSLNKEDLLSERFPLADLGAFYFGECGNIIQALVLKTILVNSKGRRHSGGGEDKGENG